MTSTLKRTAAGVALVFFLAASILNGVCICSRLAVSDDDGGPCMVSLDVCGASASTFAVQGMTAATDNTVLTEFYFPTKSLLPPQPGQAVASADPGETGKPPEA